MEKAREDVARTGLDALKGYGFALAGASASELHGLISRPTRDLDLFTNLLDKGRFEQALQDLSAAYRSDGSSVRTVQQSDVFARLEITTTAGAVEKAREDVARTGLDASLGVIFGPCPECG
jgi:hypothetical protein